MEEEEKKNSANDAEIEREREKSEVEGVAGLAYRLVGYR